MAKNKNKKKITNDDIMLMKKAYHRNQRMEAGVYHKPAHQVFQSKKKHPGKKVTSSDY